MILDALSLRAVRHRLDKRKLQEELDLHRLFLLTAYHSRIHQGIDLGDEAATVLDAEAQSLGAEGLRSAVSSHLSHQLVNLTKTLHTALSAPEIADAAASKALAAQCLSEEALASSLAAAAAPPPTPQQRQESSRGLGFGFAAEAAAAREEERSSPPSSSSSMRRSIPAARLPAVKLSQNRVSDLLLASAGFSLHVASSSIPHAAAGDGVWLRGRAEVGQVVALYPGIAYPPLFHRNIPGYPLVARSNPYLLSRFDGVVLDAKPWGKGWSGEEGDGWPVEEVQNEAEAALPHLESRNPLALAHWANHPPAGIAPNVVVAPLTWAPSLLENDLNDANSWDGKWAELRAYVPVVQFSEDHKGKERMNNPRKVMLPPPKGWKDEVPLVGLVAVRELEDEELFLNYRLNPNAPGGLPEWYTSVDPDEDARRWA